MNTSCRIVAAPLLALAATLAVAQSPLDPHDAPGRAGPPVHVATFGPYTLRANAIPVRLLPRAATERHRIERSPEHAILNLVVLEQRGDQQVTVRAAVTASKHNLLGQSEPIGMREVDENGRVSYLGTFGFAPLRNMRFTVTATPAGSSEPLKLDFEDRFVVRE